MNCFEECPAVWFVHCSDLGEVMHSWQEYYKNDIVSVLVDTKGLCYQHVLLLFILLRETVLYKSHIKKQAGAGHGGSHL